MGSTLITSTVVVSAPHETQKVNEQHNIQCEFWSSECFNVAVRRLVDSQTQSPAQQLAVDDQGTNCDHSAKP